MSDLRTEDGTRQRPIPETYRQLPPRRLSTETKHAFKTTEFWVFLAAVAGVLVASQLVGSGKLHGDYFRADKAWLYIVILTVGYMVSRGLAKMGSREPYNEA